MTYIEALEKVSNRVIKDAKLNLRDGNHKATGALDKSLNYSITKKSRTSIEILFGGTEYAEYVDQGRRPGKGIPLDALKKWLKIKKIDSSLSFVINKKIKEEGIKPTFFYTKALDDNQSDYDDCVEAYLDEIVEDLENMFPRKFGLF